MSKPVRMCFSVPQESVLGPKVYTMYTKPVGHFYADESQLYMSLVLRKPVFVEFDLVRH